MWWPHAEALYALLRAYQITGEGWCLDWYRRVHDYTFTKFPNRKHGDWHQHLDRKGRRVPPADKSQADKDREDIKYIRDKVTGLHWYMLDRWKIKIPEEVYDKALSEKHKNSCKQTP